MIDTENVPRDAQIGRTEPLLIKPVNDQLFRVNRLVPPHPFSVFGQNTAHIDASTQRSRPHNDAWQA